MECAQRVRLLIADEQLVSGQSMRAINPRHAHVRLTVQVHHVMHMGNRKYGDLTAPGSRALTPIPLSREVSVRLHVLITWSVVQAYQTMRKGNKKFTGFDLSLTLEWEGAWLEGGLRVRPCPGLTAEAAQGL